MRKSSVALKILSVFLTALVMIPFLVSCGGNDESTVISYKGIEIKGYMYRWWLSELKSYYVTASDDTAEYWKQPLENGETYESYLKGIITEQIESYAVYLSVFDEKGLALSAEKTESVEQKASDLLAAFNNDEAALNEKLAVYGLDYAKYKEVLTLTAKVQTAYSYLFEENGEHAVTDANLDEYYKNNYSHVKILVVNNVYEYVYGADGTLQYDASTGLASTTPLTEEKKAEKNALSSEIQSKIDAGEDFDSLLAQYNEDIDAIYYPNGYYMCANDFQTFGSDIVKAAMGLAVGEVTKIEDETGIFFIKKYELPEAAYSDPTDSEQFVNLYTYCLADATNRYIAEFLPDVSVNSSAIAGYTVAGASLSGQ